MPLDSGYFVLETSKDYGVFDFDCSIMEECLCVCRQCDTHDISLSDSCWQQYTKKA